MGNNQSASANALDSLISKAKFDIVVRCLEHLDFMEITHTVIDVGIEDLSKALNEITNRFREEKIVDGSSPAVYRDVVEEVERFCNANKYSVRLLFETLETTTSEFETLASEISHIDFALDDEESFYTDNDCLLAMQELCGPKIAEFFEALQKAGLTHNICASRMSTLRRMLYKEAESIVKEEVRSKVFHYKSSVIDSLDNVFCLGMTQGMFDAAQPDKARELLKTLIVMGRNARYDLMNTRYNEQDILNAAIDEISFWVENAIRRVQLTFSLHSHTALEALMDLEIDDKISGEGEEGEDDEDEDGTEDSDVVLIANGFDSSESEEDEGESNEDESNDDSTVPEEPPAKRGAAATKGRATAKPAPKAAAKPGKIPAVATTPSKRIAVKAIIPVESESGSEEEESEEEEEAEEEKVKPAPRSAKKVAVPAATTPAKKAAAPVKAAVVKTPKSAAKGRGRAAAAAAAAAKEESESEAEVADFADVMLLAAAKQAARGGKAAAAPANGSPVANGKGAANRKRKGAAESPVAPKRRSAR